MEVQRRAPGREHYTPIVLPTVVTHLVATVDDLSGHLRGLTDPRADHKERRAGAYLVE